MYSRRLFVVVSAVVAALGIALIGASLLGLGGNAVEDSVHNVAEVCAGAFAAVICFVEAVRTRGRRRIAWLCWSMYAVLEVVSGWNALAAHTVTAVPSWTDVAIVAQVPFGLVAAVTFLRVRAPRLAVAVAYCDGLLMGGAVLVLGLASGYYTALDGRTPIDVSIISLAQPITDVVVLMLFVAVTARIGRRTRPVALLLCAAVVAIGISDTQLAHQVGLGQLDPGSSLATGWTVGLLFLGIAALYPLCFRRQPTMVLADTTRSRTVMWVPIVPVAIACFIGVGLRAGDAQITRALVWVMLALISVTLLRMYFALYMNLGLGRALEHQASHDSLTGLPNRTLLKRRLDRALADIDRSQQHVTLLMLDLDGFKEVNDTFGHSAGDQVLVQVAERVVNSVRDVDLVARLGGDEFAVVLANSPAEQAIALARRVLASLELPIALRMTTAGIATSIGIATGGLGDTADELLRNADLAMYAAKDAGGNGYALYKPSMHAAVAERVRVETALRTAWLTGDLMVHYQPIVDLNDGRMVSVEALARWRHPDGDMIPPSVFIPIAERTGLIIPIGARVLNEACRCLAAWQAEYGGTADLAMSVNVSPRQLYSDDLVEIVQEALRATRIDPRCLILEVTETAMTDDTDSAIRILSRLKALGVRMAIDDFGVGASSLARLRRLPVDIVKVDRSLVDHVPDGHVATRVLDAVIGVVNALQLRTVIEGVARADQAEHLRESGYDLAQGFHFAMPMSGEAIEEALALAQPSGLVHFPLTSETEPVVERRASRRIVVVDDDEAVGGIACGVLVQGGARAVLAVTIREAMAELSNDTDAMVIDIGLPDGDGWSLISHIRESATNADMPIVVMTGLLDSAAVLNRAYDLRCEYLGKPFAAQALLAKLESAQRIVAHESADALESSPSDIADPAVVAR